MKHNFANIESSNDVEWKIQFSKIYDDSGEFIAVSKNEYVCYLGEKTIHYRIAVQLTDGNSFEDGNNKIFTNVFLVPTFMNLHKNRRISLVESLGWTEQEDFINEFKDKNNLLYYREAVLEGIYALLWQCEYDYDEGCCDSKMDEIMNDIASTYHGIIGLIGFYLDRPTNMIGMIGWDWLRQFCNGVKMTTILRELKKRYAE